MGRACRWFSLLLAVLVAVSCLSFSGTVAAAEDAPAYKNLVPGTWGNAVTRLQKRLIALGYLAAGGADGEYGPKTVKAVRRFQSDSGLEVTGRADPETQALLFSDGAVSRKTQKAEPKPTPKPKKTKRQTEPPVTVIGDMQPYLMPGPYVTYNDDSAVIAEAARICQGLTDPMEILQTVQEYVCRRLHYDYIKAVTVEPGYTPDPDAILESRLGICLDIAAVTACMLRSQGVPTRLEFGYADTTYHAWNAVWINDHWVRVDLTARITAAPFGSYETTAIY